MGIFKNLFKRKEGGTKFGNLLRKFSSGASGGILGNGALLKDFPSGGSDAELTTQSSDILITKSGEKPVKKTLMEKLKEHWQYVLGGVIAVSGFIYWLTTRGKKTRKKFRR